MTVNIDFRGLSEPIVKLIEVVSEGIGAIFKPWMIKRIAKAEACAKKELASTDSEIVKLLLPSPELTQISDEENPKSIKDAELENIEERARTRYKFQEEKRQNNIENIAYRTILELPEKVSKEPVDPDWIARFFTAAQDISSEDMQRIWSKLLAGEISAPNKFSLNTIDTLKNLTTYDAKALEKAGRFGVGFGPATIILNTLDGFFQKGPGPNYGERLHLQELGLLVPHDGLSLRFDAPDNPVILLMKGMMLKLAFPKETLLPIFKFTRSGGDLVSLLDFKVNADYLSSINSYLSKNNICGNISIISGEIYGNILERGYENGSTIEDFLRFYKEEE